MGNPRVYGAGPHEVAVVHGGPGAPGSVADLARALLSRGTGVIEPLQTMRTVSGQVDELDRMLTERARLPAVLIGHSWGAWLSWMLAARYPSRVRKLVLVASGPFEARYAGQINPVRLGRLEPPEREELSHILSALPAAGRGRDALLSRLGELTLKTDSFDLLPRDPVPDEAIPVSAADFVPVWNEASNLRATGALLDMAPSISCPVVAIHGDHDPHPAEGVETPLRSRLDEFSFHLLRRCGHYPWRERHAAGRFFEILLAETGS